MAANDKNALEEEQPINHPLIHQALSDVMGDVTAVGKDSTNQSQNFKFRGIDAILNMVAPALRKFNVTVVPLVESERYEVVPTRSGGSQGHAIISVRYRFIAIDGSYVDAVVYGESMDSGDKTYSKAMSVAFRTALIQVLAIPTNDKDPDEDTYERGDGNARQQERNTPVELPEAEKKLLDDATTVDELKAVGEKIRAKEDLSPAVVKALGHYWQKRMGEVAATLVNQNTSGATVKVGATQEALDN